jgi:hypothetical protein
MKLQGIFGLQFWHWILHFSAGHSKIAFPCDPFFSNSYRYITSGSFMHKLPNRSSTIRFRLAALLICAKTILIFSTLAIYAYAFVTHNREFAMIGLILTAAVLAVFLFRFLFASSCHCPLCRVPVLSQNSCSKNNKARNLLGSYRLRIALQILFKNRFRCPYCNETTELKPRR